MSTTPPPPIVPVPGDDDENADNPLVDDELPLDPDLNDDLLDSAEADRRAASERKADDLDEQ